jgi:hypothetical protein
MNNRKGFKGRNWISVGTDNNVIFSHRKLKPISKF